MSGSKSILNPSQYPSILAIDQGTSGTTTLVLDFSEPSSPKVLGRSTVSFPQHYPQENWVEHDLEEIWASVVRSCTEALREASYTKERSKKPGPLSISAIGLTNQRETVCFYDRKTLKPLRKAIVWQCKRSIKTCEDLKKKNLEPFFRERTGLFLDPYFSGTKLSWVLQNEPELRKKIESGSALIGTVDTYLLSRLTGGLSYGTEPSNASRTLLFNIRSGNWDPELLERLSITPTIALPKIQESASLFGTCKGLTFLNDGIPITGILGDQQAALAGQRCFSPGEAKCTYGTGAFLLLNIGDKAVISEQALLTTVAWTFQSKTDYALEGSCFIAGASIQFIRDNLSLLSHSEESEALARTAAAAPDLYFVPALAGLGAPHWEPNARGAILGLTRSTSKAQLTRATLEGIAFQVNDLLDCMRERGQRDLSVLRVDGGAAANSLLLEIQSQLSGVRVERSALLETTAFGAGLFSALGAGIYPDLQALKQAHEPGQNFHPQFELGQEELRKRQLQAWERAVAAVKIFSASNA